MQPSKDILRFTCYYSHIGILGKIEAILCFAEEFKGNIILVLRRVDGSSGVEEPNPEDYEEILEEQMEEENTNAEKKPENLGPASNSKPPSSTSKPEDRKKDKVSEE